MISGISQQDVNFCALGRQGGNAAQATYIPQGGVDTVEIAGKKGKKAKKGIFAAIGTAIVAAGALIWGVKSGKLQKVDNPTNFLGKLKNVGYAVGSKGSQAVDWCANSKVGSWCKEKGSSIIDKIKGLFHKKA
ncbi:hypothetical protein IKE67_08055 [bacterium]|nr:hypothetical protein [bacterium]